MAHHFSGDTEMMPFFPRSLRFALFFAAVTILLSTAARGEDAFPLSKGQMVYVPAYSHIYIGDREQPFLLAVTLSIRNTDPSSPLTVSRVGYFDSDGRLLREYTQQPIVIQPFSSTRIVIKESDASGGSGASFHVRWQAEKSINQPIIETIMIGTKSQQGISFTSRGQVITETGK